MIKCICQYCKKEYYVYPYRIKDGTKFCSQKCVWQFHGKRFKVQYKGKGNPIWKHGGSKDYYIPESIRIHGYNCQECGTDREVETHHIDGNPFNNPEDGSNWKRLCNFHHQTEDGRIKARIKPRKTFICVFCHKPFQRKFVYMEQNSKYCSRQCANALRIKNQKGQFSFSRS